ncbi:hypothetical protein KIN20_020684 [Parelaphostrongylus tenuis]|nr:hypothetical protein KIN20_020684 [Parelaphostrongylus tenuis]
MIELDEKISANKWRTGNKPVVLDSPKNDSDSSPSQQQNNNHPAPRLLCTTCGSTFSDRSDLRRHVTNVHRQLKCEHCGDMFNGYAKLKTHEMLHRDYSFICKCGASFKREAELRTHRDSCRNRGSFLCLVCEEIFVQRIQLDRHWNKQHFMNTRCDGCGWIASAPLRMAEHAFQLHRKNICGYCGVNEPSPDHITTMHWKRLNRSIPIRNAVKKCINDVKGKVSSSHDDHFDSTSSEIDEESLHKSGDDVPEVVLTAADCKATTAFSSPNDRAEVSASTVGETSGAEHDCYLSIVLSIPDDVVDEFHLGTRLPIEVRRLFPELSSTRVSIVEPFVGQQRFLSLKIPVSRPQEVDLEMERLLSTPIYL